MATAKKPDQEDLGEELSATVDMSGNLPEVEIEIEDDVPPKDRGRKPLEKKVEDPTDEELEAYGGKVKARIKELTHARHDERRRAETLQRERDELERVAAQLLQERNTLTKRYNAGAEQYGKVASEAAAAAVIAAKAKLKAAHEAFDNDAIVEAQADLSSAIMRVEQAKSYKPAPVQEREEEVQQRQSQQQAVKPDQKSLNWQANNQWFGAAGNEDATSFALGLHQKLVNSGVDPKSDEYYEQIDARMKSKFPELFDEEDEEDDAPKKPSSKKPPTVVAPASRQPATPGKVRLTKTQVALAAKFGLTPQQYAAQVIKLQQENSNG